MKRKGFLSILIVLYSNLVFAIQGPYYIVQNGDTFSMIAYNQFGGPAWGKDGAFEKLSVLNPEIKNPNLIFVGQKIVVSDEVQNSLSQNQPEVRSVATEKTPAQTTEVKNQDTPHEQIQKPLAVNQALPASENQKTFQKVEEPEQVLHQVDLVSGFQFTTLNSGEKNSSTTANLYSSHDVMLGAAWKQNWSDEFATRFLFSARSLDFQPSTNSAKTLSNTNKTLFNMSVGGENKISDKFSLNYSLGVAQNLFIRGLSASTITVDAVSTPEAKIGLQYEFLKKGSTSLGFQGSGSYYFPSSTDSYSVSSGYGYSAGLVLSYKYKPQKEISLNLGYKTRYQDTSILNLNEQNIFGTLIFSSPLFGEEK